MKLYHGSNVEVIQPKIIKSNRALDFGTAFYVTSDYEQAKKWAKLTADRKKTGIPTVSEYEFDENDILELVIKKFGSADADWLRFISICRSDRNFDDPSDIIIGPVADDRTFDVIQLYLIGVYDEEEAIKRLLPFKLSDQYAFKNERALEKLPFVRRVFV